MASPQSSAVYNNRGDAHLDIGEPDLAIADYSTAINLDPNSAGAYYDRANAYIIKGEAIRAIDDLTAFIVYGPVFLKAITSAAYFTVN